MAPRQIVAAILLLALLPPLAAFTASPSAASLSLAAAPSRWATFDGIRVHYKLLGRGKTTIVLVHGWGGDLNVWREQTARFGTVARLLLIDLPGHGKSDKPKTTYSMKLFARAIRAAMDDARIDRAVLVGHSMGTPVIRQFDRMYPHRSRALVAVDGFLRNPLDAEQAEAFIAPLRGDDYQAVVAKRIDSMTKSADAAVRDGLRATAADTPQHVLVGAMEGSFLDPTIWKDDKISVPLAVIVANSPQWTDEYQAWARALAADVDWEVIDGAGHYVMLEKPAEFNERLAKFLVKHGYLR
ncbi:MAG TPA: alpha/beta hydrolase [Thermoanaerobaculia bacterium]|nr:alpha/beta hydrolase [Thermoanaerobaculia bacterium]